MAIMYGGEPLPTEESPQFQPSALGPSLYTLGNIRYRIGDRSITIYAFEDDSSDEDVNSEKEDDSDGEDVDTDFESRVRVFRCRRSRAGPDTPPDPPPVVPPKIIELEDLPESSAKNPEAAEAEASGGSGAAAAAAAAAAGPSCEAGPSTSAQAGPSASTSTALCVYVPPPPTPPQPPLAYWLPRSSGSAPRDAVLVGRDLDGGPLYVGRACVYGELLPGKVATHHRVCYVASEGRELAFEKYEVLTLKRGRVEWVPGENGSFPFDAFPAGLTLQNQRVYVARARIRESGVLTPGRLVVSEKVCRISYNMKEHKYSEYEILTVRQMDSNEYGLVRYVSAENLYYSEQHQKRFRLEGWCGTNMMSGMEYPELSEYEDEEDDEEEQQQQDIGDEDGETDEDDDDDEEEGGGGDEDDQVLQILPDDQMNEI